MHRRAVLDPVAPAPSPQEVQATAAAVQEAQFSDSPADPAEAARQAAARQAAAEQAFMQQQVRQDTLCD